MDREIRNPAFPRMIAKFCRQRASAHLPPREVELLAAYMIDLFERGRRPPSRGRGLDWMPIADEAGVEADGLLASKDHMRAGFEALRRELRKPTGRPRGRPRKPPQAAASRQAEPKARKSRSRAKAEHASCGSPEPEELEWIDPATFPAAFDLHVRRHRDTLSDLVQALEREGCKLPYSTLRMWRLGLKTPSHHASLEVLSRLEQRWRLPTGYFAGKLAAQPYVATQLFAADEQPEARGLLRSVRDDLLRLWA